MNNENTTIAEKREKLGLYLGRLKGNCRRETSFVSKDDDTKKLDACRYYIEQIELLLKDCTTEELQEIMGGEFEKDYLNGMPFNISGVELPAYFLIDMISMFIKKDYASKEHSKEEAEELLGRLSVLREKAAGLDYDKAFDPNKTLNPRVLEFFMDHRRSDYYVHYEVTEGVRHLAIELRSVHEEGIYKYGELRDTSVSHSNDRVVLYEEDKKKIEDVEINRLKELKGNYLRIVSEYFVDGVMPKPENFESSLIRSDLHPKLKGALKDLVDDRYYSSDDDFLFSTSSTAKYHVNYIINIEERVREEEEKRRKEEEERKEREAAEAAEKSDAIDLARERYMKKSFLWRLVHRRENINKLDLDAMTTEQISQLYEEQNNNGNKKK